MRVEIGTAGGGIGPVKIAFMNFPVLLLVAGIKNIAIADELIILKIFFKNNAKGILLLRLRVEINAGRENIGKGIDKRRLQFIIKEGVKKR